jgi:uncharacterized protein (TIGR02145 family)
VVILFAASKIRHQLSKYQKNIPMKKIFISLAFLIDILCLYAQSPDKMSYQCIVRNSSGVLVTNQGVGIRISILQGTPTGTAVFQETYNPDPQTNANGLVSIEIGGGLTISGAFSNINWANGPYFLKTETDPSGGTNYTIIGVSQLLSVPYAMYANTAGNVFSGNYTDLTNKPILFSGSYTDLINKPILFDGKWMSIIDKPTTIAGYGISDAVITSGNQIIAGNKTFSGITSVISPVNANDATTKAYVDAILDKVLQIQAELGVKDSEGNIYKAVKIGSQVWMAENLKVTRYNDGTSIPLVTDNTSWSALLSPGYCWYNNYAATYENVYGALYNWFTVDASSNGGKNVCPAGWHVPNDVEWFLLADYLTTNGYGYQGSGNDIAKSLASTTGWTSDDTAGNIGNDQASNNRSGFSGLPGGLRNSGGGFDGLGTNCRLWEDKFITSDGSIYAVSCLLWASSSTIIWSPNYRQFGFNIRCLKDN